MYSLTQFYDRQMFACSVPPSVSPNLSDGFQELSRIHFYLGRQPIDFMIEDVEKASLEHIAQGTIQIYFAVKEIQDFMTFGGNSSNDNPNLYIEESFNSILKHTIEVLDSVYKKPTKKDNFLAVETMLGLTHEVKYLQHELSLAGIDITSGNDKLSMIEEKYEKILKLKDNYENLINLKEFSAYEEKAKQSVIEQLKQKYDFNYQDLSKIYLDTDSWMGTLHYLAEKRQEMLDNPEYVYNLEEAQELKDSFLTQLKSFNQLLKNGVVNYIHSYAAKINKTVFYDSLNSMIGTQEAYNREINYHKKAIESYYGSRDYHKEKLATLEANKEEFINRKKEDKNFYEEKIISLNRQEKYIYQTLDKVRKNLFNINIKDTLTFEGDINVGFVVGKFSNNDKVMLIHRDNFVNTENAIYASILKKEDYDNLVKNNKLEFNQEFRESKFSASSNFYNYGQFLQEISSSYIQNFFLGQEFDLVDKTEQLEKKKKVSMKM